MGTIQTPPGLASRQRDHDAVTDARFAVPSTLRAHVRRTRLLDLLDGAASAPLVLVSAPAGTGKTTLVADWLRTRRPAESTGWVTFEDEEEEHLWPPVLECLTRMGVQVPPVGDAQSPLEDDRLAALAAAVAAQPTPMVLVLDGLTLASAADAHDLDYLLRHAAPRLQLVVTTRADPVLPVYRYRLEDALVELRAAQLAFSDDEAAALLRVSGVRLGRESVRALNARVRGWAAGLRFAAMALRDQDRPEHVLGPMVAESGDMGEYLVGEVLQCQKPEVRQLLLDTSVPDLLYPGLVEELVGQVAVRDLAQLTRMNVFVEGVEDHPGCYRYPPFFRDFLRAELAYESPDRPAGLHRACARWFARQGFLLPAVGHLVAVGAWEEAAAQVVDGLLVGRLLHEGATGTWGHAFHELPADQTGPAVSVVRAALALAAGDHRRAAEGSAQARAAYARDAACSDQVAVAVAVLDAVGAQTGERPGAALALAQDAERVLQAHLPGAEAAYLAALVHACRGKAHLRQGDLSEAAGAFAAGVEAASASAGQEWLRAECHGYLALLYAAEGRLSRARRLALQAIAVDDSAGSAVRDRCPAAQVALAWVMLERYDLDAVDDHVKAATRCRSLGSDPISSSLLAAARAGLLHARGRTAEAVEGLAQAISAVPEDDRWLADRLRVDLARIRVAGGDAELAIRELQALGDWQQPELALVAAEAHLECGHVAEATRALAARPEADTLRAEVAGLLVEAVHECRRDAPGRAMATLDRSLRLAAPEGWRRPFREAPKPVQHLLVKDPRLAARNPWLRSNAPHAGIPSQRRPGPSTDRPDEAPPAPQVVERLTAREQEILGHLADLLSTEEIAETMFVSVNTVRTHIRSILRKLSVTRRNAAVRRARELGLIER